MKVPVRPLAEIREEVSTCKACSLCEGRTNVVFGEGNPHARVMIIGEAPGKNEDLQGKPFVGAAGKFLDELLEVAGLKREDVFIAKPFLNVDLPQIAIQSPRKLRHAQLSCANKRKLSVQMSS